MTPTEHLKYQWAQAAARFGIAIDPSYRNAQGKAGADFQGVAVTYAQVAAHPALHRGRTENRTTLVIFDEIHHAGDALSWGDAVEGGVRAGQAAARADRDAVQVGREPDSFRDLRRRRLTGPSGRPPTTCTGTARRWPTASCGR